MTTWANNVIFSRSLSHQNFHESHEMASATMLTTTGSLMATEQTYEYEKTLLKTLLFSTPLTVTVTLIFSGFITYPFFKPASLDAVLGFWPLLAYGLIAAILPWWNPERSENKMFVLTAIAEEIGFRGLFIVPMMCAILCIHWLWLYLIAPVLGLALFMQVFVTIIEKAKKENWRDWVGEVVVCAVVSYVCLYSFLFHTGPMLEIFKLFSSLFPSGGSAPSIHLPDYGWYPKLFLFSLLVLNLVFRDGYKFTGKMAHVNTLIVGMTLNYALLAHGMQTAIVLHVVLNTSQYGVRLLVRRFG